MRAILYFFLKAIFFPIWKERNSGSKWKTPFHFSSFNFYPLFFHPNQTYHKNMRLNSIRMWCKTHVLLFQFQHAILFYHIYIYIYIYIGCCWRLLKSRRKSAFTGGEYYFHRKLQWFVMIAVNSEDFYYSCYSNLSPCFSGLGYCRNSNLLMLVLWILRLLFKTVAGSDFE